jgi:hypothetical protein
MFVIDNFCTSGPRFFCSLDGQRDIISQRPRPTGVVLCSLLIISGTNG